MSRRRNQPANSTNKGTKDTCFVIMPFGGYFNLYYDSIYKDAIIEAGLKPRRGDDLYRASNIVQDIWELTKESKLVLADLTGKNPNVFYELGLAHALAKPAILITETIEDIPFDLRGLRIIVYDKNKPDWGVILKGSIVKAIEQTLESPNSTIPTAYLENKRSAADVPHLTKHDKELIELKQELESIKRQLLKANEPYNKYPRGKEYEAILYANNLIALNVSMSEIVERLSERFQMPINWAIMIYEKAKGGGGPAGEYSYAMAA